MSQLKSTLYLMLFLFNCLATNAFSIEIDAKKDIELEYQTKTLNQSKNDTNSSSEWDNENVQQLSGHIEFDLSLWDHKFSGSGFFLIAKSELIDEENQTNIYSPYPQYVVGRDLFKLYHQKTTGNTYEYGAINRFEYEWGDDEFSVSAGRLFVDFGHGATFNPINPFHLNTSFSNSSLAKLGNDGMKFKIHRDEQLKINIYIFGDKRFTSYEKKVTRSIILHGDWQLNSDTHINYILGEDLKRHKYGFEISKSLEESMIFAQFIKLSQRIDSESAKARGLSHNIIGVKHNFNSSFKSTLEIGKNEISSFQGEVTYINYLPLETYMAVHSTYDFSEKVSLSINYAVDTKSKFSYLKVELPYNFHKNYQLRVFSSGPASSTDKSVATYAEQSTIPYEFGVALKAVF